MAKNVWLRDGFLQALPCKSGWLLTPWPASSGNMKINGSDPFDFERHTQPNS
jgi:hypothetical protein